MKKLCILISFTIILCIFTSCSNSKNNSNEKISIGTYKLKNGKEATTPNVILKENKEFEFSYSVTSDYLPVGTYEISKNYLTLKTSDGKNKYKFKINDNSLIFDKKDSSPIPSDQITDGSVFELK